MFAPCTLASDLLEFDRTETARTLELRQINDEVAALMRADYNPGTPENFAEAMREVFTEELCEEFAGDVLALIQANPGPLADLLKTLARTYWEEQATETVEGSHHENF